MRRQEDRRIGALWTGGEKSDVACTPRSMATGPALCTWLISNEAWRSFGDGSDSRSIQRVVANGKKTWRRDEKEEG